MTTFIDTTALFALLDEDDAAYSRAASWFTGAGADPGETLITHNYIVVESIALTHRRLGEHFVRSLVNGILPALAIEFVGEELHERAVAAYLGGLGRRSSFVDRVSFELMRERSIVRAFSFDRDFSREGFEVVP